MTKPHSPQGVGAASGWNVRYFTFLVMSVFVGVVSAFSAAGAVAGAIMVFGFGVSEICDALATRGRQ